MKVMAARSGHGLLLQLRRELEAVDTAIIKPLFGYVFLHFCVKGVSVTVNFYTFNSKLSRYSKRAKDDGSDALLAQALLLQLLLSLLLLLLLVILLCRGCALSKDNYTHSH
jgi:hypothetical protein